VIDEFEMERLLLRRFAAGDQQSQIQWDHRGRRTEFASDRGEMIAGNGPMEPPTLTIWLEARLEETCDDAAARIGILNVTKSERVPQR